jgi:hypothetical protein
VVVARDGKEVKGAYQKKDTQEQTLFKNKQKKLGKLKRCLLFQPRRLIFLW